MKIAKKLRLRLTAKQMQSGGSLRSGLRRVKKSHPEG